MPTQNTRTGNTKVYELVMMYFYHSLGLTSK